MVYKRRTAENLANKKTPSYQDVHKNPAKSKVMHRNSTGLRSKHSRRITNNYGPRR